MSFAALKNWTALKNWKCEIFLCAYVALYLLICWAGVYMGGVEGRFRPLLYLDNAAFFGWLFLRLYIFYYVVRLYVLLIRNKPKDWKGFIKDNLLRGPLNKDMWLRVLPVMAAVIVLLSVFTSMKALIAHFVPFGPWDAAFIAWDRALHFGQDPWRLLQPLLGYPIITYAVNLVYNAWIVILFVMLYWQLFRRKDPEGRMRFFISFALLWSIGGTLAALIFSSAGPCFYERLTGDATFAPLMEYLHHANSHYQIFALPVQDKLWESYTASGLFLGSGISAMPSLHVGTCFLYLLLALQQKWRAWPVFAVFFGLVLVGSVHLGWHYAVDGYIAIAITWPLWFISGWIVNRLKPEYLNEHH